MATPTKVLDIARGEIGYSRWDDPQPGSKYGRWYAQLTGDSYYGANGVPYCAMFVSWVFAQAGQSAPGLPGAYCPWIVNAGRQAGATVPVRQAKAGDIVLFDWGGDGVSDHVGIVESNNGSYLTCIEGNTSNGNNSNGGYVQRRTRAYSTVVCIIRPTYTGDDDMPQPSDLWNYDNAMGKVNEINARAGSIENKATEINGKLDSVLNKVYATSPIVPFGGPVHRLYNRNGNGAHAMTNSPDLISDLTSVGWTDEGAIFELGTEGEAVWGMYNPNTDDYLLTANQNEARGCVATGWISWGIIGTIGDGPEVYRLYNGNVPGGQHLFTINKNEVSALVGQGWTDEGIAFNAI